MNDRRDEKGDAFSEAGAWPLSIYESLTSTNELIKDHIRSGGALPASALAFEQTAGYGRQGRSWSSPFGGLYLSIGVRPTAPLAAWPTLSLVTALAVRAAIGSIHPSLNDVLLVKWPNDGVIAVDGSLAKLCGISNETCAGALCIGIGVNVFPPQDRADAPVAPYPVAYLYDEAAADEVMRTELVALARAIIDECAGKFAAWERNGFAAFVDDYNALNVLSGAEITVSDLERRHERRGVAGDVGVDGRLALRDAQGAVHWISSGEAHLQGCLCRR